MKKDVQTKKKMFCSIKCLSRNNKILLVLLSAMILIMLSIFIYLFFFHNKANNVDDSVFYYPAYESENIFENDAYLSFERGLRYSYGGVEQLYRYDVDYSSADNYCKFFLDYFKTLTEGKGEELSKFYVDDYFESVPQFTMQMIYEPFVMFHSESKIEENGDEINVANFEVRYKIFKNNGSFRQGVPSNQAIPQIYQLIVQNDNIKIKNVLEIELENEN